MPQPRFDPLGRRWVLLAPERAARGAPSLPPAAPDPAPCDFCEGQEHRTPPETFAVRGPGSAADGPGWLVRAVPNLYPATPFHEVVVHAPRHEARFEDIPPSHRAQVLRAWRERLRAAGAACTLAAFNRGPQAGASRSHEHSQVWGLPLVPPALRREADAFAEPGCVLCALRAQAPHVVRVGAVWAVVHPVPLVAHELLVVPPCAPRFTDAEDALVADTAEAVAQALARLRRTLGEGLATNLVLHTGPPDAPAFHWHLHLYPRTAVWGGLELGAELPVVAADPEATAGLLGGP